MGEQFGHYEILRRLAAGGMAEVFLAKQTGLGGFERLVCIKRILPHLSEQDDFITMFLDEARIAANLIHPNIAQIYDIGEAEGSYYIAMEYVRGEDLRRVYNQEVKRGRAIPFEPAAQIVMGAAAGLDYAHRQTSIDGRPLGLVHRDISPQNVLVTYDGHVKLVDFGVAKAANKMNQTRSGVLKGKYSYMSPEQASGDPIDARTDIFALGITLYEVTTGTRLFKRETEIDTLHAVIACNVTPPSDIVPGYERHLEDIVMRALAFEPDDRFPTAGEMARELEQFLINQGHPTGSSTLGAFMQDLFAEKLADELLFGGQPWEENFTPSKAPGTRRLKTPKPGTRRSRSSRSNPRREKDFQDATEGSRELDDATVIDEAPGAAPRATPARADDWDSRPSVSKTATQSRMTAAVAGPDPAYLDHEPTARRKILPWVVLVSLASIVAGGGIAMLFGSSGAKHQAQRSGSLVVDSEPRGARVEFIGEGAEALNRRYEGHRTVFTITEGVPIDKKLSARFIKDGFEVVERALPALSPGIVPEPLFAELPSTELGAEPASLILLSTPPGAQVWINGKQQDGLTPMTEVRVRGGETHKVEFRKEGYQPRWETIFVETGSRRFIEMTLLAEKNKGEITTVAAPKTKEAGSTESTAPKTAEKNKSRGAAHPTRAKKATLTVSAPERMRVSIDGRFVGHTPISGLSIDAGQHTVRIYNEESGFSTTRKVRTQSGRNQKVEVAPKKGNLSLNAIPWAWVRLGKGSPTETPLRLSVYEGEYTLTFECPDGTTKQEKAQVNAGKTTSVSVNCRK